MTLFDLSTLKRGDGIVVSFGSRGSQYALVLRVAGDGRTARISKWLAKGKRWTKPLTIYPVDVKRRAALGEYRPSERCPALQVAA